MEIKRTRRKTCVLGGSGGGPLDGDLSEWFLFELLCRVPVDDVFKFKCVSKQWNSLISEPSFSGLYISRLPFSGRRPFVFDPHNNQRVDQDGSRLKYPERHFLTLPIPDVEVSISKKNSGSFHTIAIDKGFLLVGWLMQVSEKGSDFKIFSGGFYICSAATHQRFSLPPLPPGCRFTMGSVALMAKVEEARRVLASYKVIVIDFGSLPVKGFLEAKIFSSEKGRWEHVRVQFQSRISVILYSRKPVRVNNTLYWAPNQGMTSRRSIDSKILAYDPYSGANHSSLIEFPDNDNSPRRSDRWYSFDSQCGVCQGRLKYFRKTRNDDIHNLKIWELQNDNSWCLQYTVMIENLVDGECGIHSSIRIFSPPCHPFDPHVIYLNLGPEMGMVSCNILTKEFEQVAPYGHDNLLIEELPSWPIAIPPSLMSKST